MLDQAAFNENPDLEFMPPVKASSVPVVVLGKFSELECKDAGINYQRVKVGMQEKGKSDLAERLLYEGAKENHDDKMYWKGSDIDRFWIASATQRFCRTNYHSFIRPNEVVHLNETTFNTKPKILLRQTADRVVATIDYRGVWFGRSVISILVKGKSPHRIEYFLGLLNSTYLRWVYHNIAHETGRVFAQVKLSKLKQLPIREIVFSDVRDKARHDEIVMVVQKLLALYGQLAVAKGSSNEAIRKEIQTEERHNDSLVYELYGLTFDDVRLIETAVKE
jgi:hypothetical protein